MPASCSANNCTNRWTEKSSITFYRFPKEIVRRGKWVAAMCRANWQPSSVSKLCSQHFESHCFEERNGKRFLKFNTVPTIFDFSKKVQVKPKSPRTQKPTLVSREESTFYPETGEMRGCCVPRCKSNKRWDKVSFHEMPSNKEVREKWVRAIRQQGSKTESVWFPDQYDLICGKHFTTDDYKPSSSIRSLKPHAVPSMFSDDPECRQKESSSKRHKGTAEISDPSEDATTVVGCGVNPVDCAYTVVHYCPPEEEESVLLSNEKVYNCTFGKHRVITQRGVLEASKNYDMTVDTNHHKAKSSSSFLRKQLDSAQRKISDLQCCITKLKEQNVKLQWEKESTLVRNLHDIKQDAVDGNYDAIILLNRIVHYSPPEGPDN